MALQSTDDAGAVRSLWRYPVKSMRGEELDEALVIDGGILGDRAYAVIDLSNGKIASAKFPRKWSKLLELSASLVEQPRVGDSIPPVRIAWPEGADVTSSEEDLSARLSETLGCPVSVTTSRPESASVERLDPLATDESILDIGALMMEGRFSDYAAVHLLTTSTLTRLSELYPGARFDERRFRPNVVVETSADQSGFAENAWVGRTVTIGDEVRLRVTDPTPRCAIPTLAQGDLPKDPGVLRTIAEHNMLEVPVNDRQLMPSAGVYAFVVQGGTVRRGDPVRIE